MNDNLLRFKKEIKKCVLHTEQCTMNEILELYNMCFRLCLEDAYDDILTVIIEVYDEFIMSMRNKCDSIQNTIAYCKTNGVINAKNIDYIICECLKNELSQFIAALKTHLDKSIPTVNRVSGYLNRFYISQQKRKHNLFPYKNTNLKYSDIKDMVDQIYRYRMDDRNLHINTH